MKVPSSLSGRKASDDRAPKDDDWVDREIARCKFKDARLGERFRKLLGQIASAVGSNHPLCLPRLG